MKSCEQRVTTVTLIVLVIVAMVTPLAYSRGAEERAEEVVSISFWHGETQPVRVAAFQEMIDRFERENPGIRVTQSDISNVDMLPRMVAAFEAGTEPEMAFSTAPRTLAFYTMGRATPHDDLVEWVDREYGYVQSQIDPYYFDGHYWAVPTWTISLMLFYRQDILEDAGYDGPPTTWDEMLEMARELTTADRYGVALPTSAGQNATDQIVWAFMSTNNGVVIDERGEIAFANERSVETIEFLTELARYSPPDSAAWSFGDLRLALETGQAAMGVLYGSLLQDVADLEFGQHLRATTIPIARDGRPGGLTSPNSVMIFTEDERKRAAAEEFIKFLFRPENYGWWLANMQPGLFMPITQAGRESADFWNHPIIQQYEDIIHLTLEQVETGSRYGFEYEVRNPFIGEIAESFILADTFHRAAIGELNVRDAVEWGEAQMIDIAR